MRSPTYYYYLSAYVSCSHCPTDNSRKLVTVQKERECEDDDRDDLPTEFEDLIEDQKEKDGWDGDICPDCQFVHGDEIRAERAAENNDITEE